MGIMSTKKAPGTAASEILATASWASLMNGSFSFWMFKPYASDNAIAPIVLFKILGYHSSKKRQLEFGLTGDLSRKSPMVTPGDEVAFHE